MTISIEKLRAVKRVVVHKNCPDGISSALIIKDALPDVEIVFMAHGTKEHRELRPDVPTLFCDFTPWSDPKTDGQWLMWIEAGTSVLDHHPTQRDLTMTFVEAGLGVYGENDRNECGAWLAYEHVWMPTYLAEHGSDDEVAKEVREFARLAGIRDTWKKSDPLFQLACEQAGILTFWGESLVERVGKNRDSIFGGGYGIEETIFHPKSRHYLGRRLFEKQLEHARTAIGEAHRFQTERGTRVLMFQGVTPTSDAAEILEKNDAAEMLEKGANGLYPVNADIVAGFHYRVDGAWLPNPIGPDTHPKLQLQFSTRSHTGYDVASFCKAHGGGGHRAAAGFTVEQSAEVGRSPYAVLKLLLEEWEQGQ